MKQVVVIPARYASSRLPGKPLVDLCGVPMIVRTCRQCAEVVGLADIIVATDDERIGDVCASEGFRVLMTSESCLTGTDRVAEVARNTDADVYINVQGDEPLFEPRDLTALLEFSRSHPDDVVNGYCEIDEEVLFRNSSIPKVVTRSDGRLLYMSRAAIPTSKAHTFASAWRQVCAYAFPRRALEEFSQQVRKTRLEEIEDIEILRFLELGWEVRMLEMSANSIAVDNPEDVARVEAEIIRRQNDHRKRFGGKQGGTSDA
ncbi:MAG: 3-deoxy-manno-octulosonate cytidylyltransferase [Lysobacteraceae bacterium]